MPQDRSSQNRSSQIWKLRRVPLTDGQSFPVLIPPDPKGQWQIAKELGLKAVGTGDTLRFELPPRLRQIGEEVTRWQMYARDPQTAPSVLDVYRRYSTARWYQEIYGQARVLSYPQRMALYRQKKLHEPTIAALENQLYHDPLGAVATYSLSPLQQARIRQVAMERELGLARAEVTQWGIAKAFAAESAARRQLQRIAEGTGEFAVGKWLHEHLPNVMHFVDSNLLSDAVELMGGEETRKAFDEFVHSAGQGVGQGIVKGLLRSLEDVTRVPFLAAQLSPAAGPAAPAVWAGATGLDLATAHSPAEAFWRGLFDVPLAGSFLKGGAVSIEEGLGRLLSRKVPSLGKPFLAAAAKELKLPVTAAEVEKRAAKRLGATVLLSALSFQGLTHAALSPKGQKLPEAVRTLLPLSGALHEGGAVLSPFTLSRLLRESLLPLKADGAAPDALPLKADGAAHGTFSSRPTKSLLRLQKTLATQEETTLRQFYRRRLQTAMNRALGPLSLLRNTFVSGASAVKALSPQAYLHMGSWPQLVLYARQMWGELHSSLKEAGEPQEALTIAMANGAERALEERLARGETPLDDGHLLTYAAVRNKLGTVEELAQNWRKLRFKTKDKTLTGQDILTALVEGFVKETFGRPTLKREGGPSLSELREQFLGTLKDRQKAATWVRFFARADENGKLLSGEGLKEAVGRVPFPERWQDFVNTFWNQPSLEAGVSVWEGAHEGPVFPVFSKEGAPAALYEALFGKEPAQQFIQLQQEAVREPPPTRHTEVVLPSLPQKALVLENDPDKVVPFIGRYLGAFRRAASLRQLLSDGVILAPEVGERGEFVLTSKGEIKLHPLSVGKGRLLPTENGQNYMAYFGEDRPLSEEAVALAVQAGRGWEEALPPKMFAPSFARREIQSLLAVPDDAAYALHVAVAHAPDIEEHGVSHFLKKLPFSEQVRGVVDTLNRIFIGGFAEATSHASGVSGRYTALIPPRLPGGRYLAGATGAVATGVGKPFYTAAVALPLLTKSFLQEALPTLGRVLVGRKEGESEGISAESDAFEAARRALEVGALPVEMQRAFGLAPKEEEEETSRPTPSPSTVLRPTPSPWERKTKAAPRLWPLMPKPTLWRGKHPKRGRFLRPGRRISARPGSKNFWKKGMTRKP